MEQPTITKQEREQIQNQPPGLEDKIIEYQNATTATLAGAANQTTNPYKSLAAYFYIYKKIGEEKKSKKPDWKKLYEQTLAPYFNIAKDKKDIFRFDSATALLQAWLAAQIGGEDELASKLFNEAKEAEKVCSAPFSKGWVHYISAMSSPTANAEDFATATQKGFDFNALIQDSFTNQFDALIEKGIQVSKPRKGSLTKQEGTPFNFLKDNYNPFAMIQFENANSAAQDYFQGMLLLSQNNIQNGIAKIYDASQAAYKGHSDIAEEFWEAAFSRNWKGMRNQLLDVLLIYNRVSEKKKTRMDLRNTMIVELKAIDASGQSDGKKITALKEKLLPLALILAGTGLSKGQKAAIRVGHPNKGLSKLSLNILKILFQQGEISESDIEDADIGHKDKNEKYYPELAKKGAKEWLKEVKKQQKKQYSDQKLYTQISAYLPKQNSHETTPTHPLSAILDLEAGVVLKFDVAAFKKAIDSYVQQGFDFHKALKDLRRQGKTKNVFAEFGRTGKLPKGASLTLFSYLSSTTALVNSDNILKNRTCGYYWLGVVVLLHKGQAEDGLRLLAEAYLLNDSAKIPIDFDLIDQGEIMSKLFKDLNWPKMLTDLQTKALTYAIEHTKEEQEEKIKINKRDPVNELRANVANKIKELVQNIPSDSNKQKISAAEITQAKQKLLLKVIELMSVGYTSPLQQANLKSPVNAIVFANMPELAKDVLDQLVSQLGLTADEVQHCCAITSNQALIHNYEFEYINDDYITSIIQSLSTSLDIGKQEVQTFNLSALPKKKYASLQQQEQARVCDAISVCAKYVGAQQPKDHAMMQMAASSRMERRLSQEFELAKALGDSIGSFMQQTSSDNNNNNNNSDKKDSSVPTF